MATIEELRREINRESNYEQGDREMKNLGLEKQQLEKQLKQMKFKRKFGKYVPNIDMNKVKKVGDGIKTGINRLGKEVGKMKEEQNRRDRQSKAIKKRKFKQYPQRSGLGLFG